MANISTMGRATYTLTVQDVVKADCQYCRGEKNGNAQDTSRSTTPDSSDAHQAEV